MRILLQAITLCSVLASTSATAEPFHRFPFTEVTVLSGLTEPTVVRFASDGRVFVAEKAGIVKVFDGLEDTTPEVLVDLTENTNSFRDHGLLGLALHPAFLTQPYLYVLYTYDGLPGGAAPMWNDTCPTPPGTNIDGCVVDARLSRFRLVEGGVDPEEILIDGGWCQQSPTHSIGTIEFGPDGALYVGAGDGASAFGVDYGQHGGSLPETPTPLNPCGDPIAEGGALRSQDLLTPDDPFSFDGTILRVDPDTGAALPDNPLVGGAAGDDRIIAHGLRNPFRFVVHPTTNEVWIGDVGWNTWEEINRIVDPTDSVVENFGWPCYEGAARQPRYDALDLALCEGLYAAPGSVEPPFFAYRRGDPPDPDLCGTDPSAVISGIAVYPGGDYPPAYHGALLFADGSRPCIWAMFPDNTGLPDPSKISTLVARSGAPVHLEIGPEGDLFYVALPTGEIRQILVDPGALFGDGFESGDATLWSSSSESEGSSSKIRLQ